MMLSRIMRYRSIRSNAILRNLNSGNGFAFTRRWKGTTVVGAELNECNEVEKPVKYTTSEAAKWKAEFLRKGVPNPNEWPTWQILSAFFSMIAFLYYFGYAREENDLDEELSMPLGKRLLKLREGILIKERNEFINNGIDTTNTDEELEEIQKLRLKYKY